MLVDIPNQMASVLTNNLVSATVVPTVIQMANQMIHDVPQESMYHLESKIITAMEKQLLVLMTYQLINPEFARYKLDFVTKNFYQTGSILATQLMVRFFIMIEEQESTNSLRGNYDN
jgi:hypothetical protein